jgi:hypothetical protein
MTEKPMIDLETGSWPRDDRTGVYVVTVEWQPDELQLPRDYEKTEAEAAGRAVRVWVPVEAADTILTLMREEVVEPETEGEGESMSTSSSTSYTTTEGWSDGERSVTRSVTRGTGQTRGSVSSKNRKP